ncbi:MAG: ABC transporter substrate-binding protein [Candidatus Harrisonbacteria bacterium]|nr:ABC transporter substrate-binding protein [Candidatus Harrisonbacteria bacterium]
MNKVIIGIGAVALVVMGFLFVGGTSERSAEQDIKIRVVASFYPLAEFARQVGGDYVEVITLTPPGASPHDFEPTPQDISAAQKGQVFIFNGAGLDPWAEKIEPELVQKGVAVVHMTKYFELLQGKDQHGDEEKAHDEEEGHSHEGELDPHIWLDPSLAMKEVELIRDTLMRFDPQNANVYEENARRYLAELGSLDALFASSLKTCKTRDIVASHGAFGYLAKRYNINVINIAGISPEEEPTPKRMAEIAILAKEKGIKYIFFETLVSPALAQTLAVEIGAKTLVMNPMEGLTQEELKAGGNYLSIMRQNLQNIRTALSCATS